MKTNVLFRSIICAGSWALALAAASVYGADQPAGSAPASAPAAAVPAGAQALSAKVEKVTGNVKWASMDADTADPAAWQPVAAGMDLPAGSQIKTSVRSQAIVRFGDDTVALVESTSLVALMELYQTTQADRVRIGLGYGAVRAGSADQGKKSKLTIETPNAVLSKEGTQGIRMSYNRGNGNFEVSLTQSGLLKVTNTITGRSLNVSPHQFLTQAMIRWIETEPFTRAPQISDAFALAANENLFSRQGGSSIFSSGGGATNGNNPVTLTSTVGQGANGLLTPQSDQQGLITQNNSFTAAGLGAPIGPTSGFTSGSSLFPIFTPSQPSNPTGPTLSANQQILIAYIQANPDLVTPYGVTVDQVVQFIIQNPDVVNNITLQDVLTFEATGQLPSQLQTKHVTLAGNLKARWTPLKTKSFTAASQRPVFRPEGSNWMGTMQTNQKILKDKFSPMPANNPGLIAKPSR